LSWVFTRNRFVFFIEIIDFFNEIFDEKMVGWFILSHLC